MRSAALRNWLARRLAVGIVLACGTTTASAAPPTGYSLTWSDEFSGSSLDLTRWGYRLSGARYDAINTSSAVSVENGNLVIRTYTDAGTNYTGMIGTQNLFAQTYGYFEARIDFNGSPGMWSAFWIQSPTVGNPIGNVAVAGAEIDIAEHRVSNTSNTDANMGNKITQALHWDGYSTSHQTVNNISGNLGLATGFHLYSVLWTPDGYTFYVDGTQSWASTSGISQRSEYLILSSEVRNNNWAGVIPGGGYGSLATTTTNMTVDYVRVYAVPEPPSVALLASGAGMLVLVGLRRRAARCRKQQAAAIEDRAA